jgi:hypothetical protein
MLVQALWSFLHTRPLTCLAYRRKSLQPHHPLYTTPPPTPTRTVQLWTVFADLGVERSAVPGADALDDTVAQWLPQE